jgi:uncharacterized protein (TIGR02246 family)
MKRTQVLVSEISLFILISCVSVCALEQGKPNGLASDEAAIRENVQEMEAGWNAKDGSLYAKSFSANADYVVINGTHVQGHDRIARGHEEIFKRIFKDSTISLSVKQIRFLGRDVAVVHVAGHLRMDRGTTRATDFIITLVVTRNGNGWKTVAFQNTEVSTAR